MSYCTKPSTYLVPIALLMGSYACGASDSQATNGGGETVVDGGGAGNDSGFGNPDAGGNLDVDVGITPVVCSDPPQQ